MGLLPPWPPNPLGLDPLLKMRHCDIDDNVKNNMSKGDTIHAEQSIYYLDQRLSEAVHSSHLHLIVLF